MRRRMPSSSASRFPRAVPERLEVLPQPSRRGFAGLRDRPQEALRLAGPRAGGHDGGTPAVRRAGIEALVRDALMAVRREAERNLREGLAAFGREFRRQRDGEVRAFDEVLLLGEKVVQNVRERRVGGAEAGGKEVLQGAGDLVGDDGGDHGV